MISIIICSTHPEISALLKENIEKTIGCPYEIVFIYNENNKYSIFEAYNLGVTKSRYEICCFMHDDIIYHSHKWGEIAVNYFKEDKNTGAIGVAGCKYLRISPVWWPISQYNVFNMIQSDRKDNSYKSEYWLNTQKELSEVALLDGIWFCIPKALFSRIRFDEKTYQGFHLYDLDIAMQINEIGYKIVSIPDVLIEHTSRGSIKKEWLENALYFSNKWRKNLPFSVVEIDEDLIKFEKTGFIKSFKKVSKTKNIKLLFMWFNIAISYYGNIFAVIKILGGVLKSMF